MDDELMAYMIGLNYGRKEVTLDSASGYEFTDTDSDGNIEITEVTE